jgi:hypothetical protein
VFRLQKRRNDLSGFGRGRKSSRSAHVVAGQNNAPEPPPAHHGQRAHIAGGARFDSRLTRRSVRLRMSMATPERAALRSTRIGSSALIVLSRREFGAPRLWQVMWGASGAGASPRDGVFVPVSPVCPLTQPNRMTVSPGIRAGRRACRTEHLATPREVRPHRPRAPDTWDPTGSGPHSVAAEIEFCRSVVARGGVLLGTLDAEQTVGLAIVHRTTRQPAVNRSTEPAICAIAAGPARCG